MCVSASGADEVTMKDFQPYIFSVTPNSYFEMKAAAARLAKLPYRRYALIGADYAGARDNLIRFKDFLKQADLNAEIVIEEYSRLGAIDYTANINKRPPRCPDFLSWPLLGVGRGKVFVCDMSSLLGEVKCSLEIPTKKTDLAVHVLLEN